MNFDWTFLLLIPAAIFAFIAQGMVKKSFNEFSQVAAGSGITSDEAARKLLDSAGVDGVKIEKIAGNLTDHYDLRSKVLRLSDSVSGSSSISAIGVAAHEVGHAIQHNKGYFPISVMNLISPVVGFSSKIAMPLIMIGLLLSSFSGQIGYILLQVGIVLFTAVVFYQLLVLPIEFNASNRALVLLHEYNMLSQDEIKCVKKVLDAAALTYVAGAASAVLQLIRLILISNRRRR